MNAFAFRFKGSEELATAFNPPFILDAPNREGYINKILYIDIKKVIVVGRTQSD